MALAMVMRPGRMGPDFMESSVTRIYCSYSGANVYGLGQRARDSMQSDERKRASGSREQWRDLWHPGHRRFMNKLVR